MDHENTVKAYSASPSMLGRGHSLLEPQGPVWSVDASQYHPQLAVGAADGSCSTTNTLRSTRRGGSVPFFVHKLYQMDYSRNTKEYRMLDRFLPQSPEQRTTNQKVVPPTLTLILLVRAHGRERLASIAYHGIVETDLQRQACSRQLLLRGFVESMCFGGDGSKTSYLMEALSRLGESQMVTVMLWTLIQKRRT
ncbi:uncharacterized protein LACBIDRAFT_307508 [Laccaria bicolor S238N-H82]|uniref:Predicted protein n=1 Tax=Laccaria bicolor (strain S238N-H82 / ATCC MYA-4686) TaxID=486041 RepID=B0DQB6_LACBS|nr:uncharacterized protein LACBIDRAFT_307508 [Laccaria bicolor S238N-H82]EDR03266.1 predicted protein [Laccaria bicolor S238N-H82]|eukprot:XP_001886062.1 predicted protein [Laccaria bicolor S238N-H82]